MEALPLKSITSASIITNLDCEWISRYGSPETIISDQGLQFESRLFQNFCNKFGIKHQRTTAYHPQANGKIKRLHRSLKSLLRASSDNANKNWYKNLPMVLLSLRNCISSDGKASPSQLTFGLDTRFPADYPRLNNKEDQDEDPKVIEKNNECFQSEGTNNRKPPRSFISKEANNCKLVCLRKEVQR